MKKRSNHNLIVLALIGVSFLSVTAWAISGPSGTEPAPATSYLAASTNTPVRVTAPAKTVAKWDLPVVRNESVDKWITFLTGRNAERTRLWLERSGRYAPYIREQLRARGLPEDLLYLAMIESGFSPRAYSRASASGIWQFIAETGRRYGLEVSSHVDERRDPIESTSAALNYLSKLHDQFGSWYLAAAAYNTGENRVERILRERAGGRRGSEDLFWRIAPYLPRETRDYVPLMLAAGHIAKDPEQYGFAGLEYHARLVYDTVWVPARTRLDVLAQAANVSKDAVRDLNPHLTRGVTPPNRSWPARVPAGTQLAVASNLPALLRSAAASSAPSKTESAAKRRYHTIRRGENLTVIARRYGLSLKKLRALNSLGSRSRIYAGRKLRVR